VDGDDEINLIILPPNAVLDLALSTLIISATQGASTLIDLGYRSYIDKDGNTVAEDVDGIYDGYDATSTALNYIAKDGGGALGALCDVSGFVVFNNREPVTIFMKALDNGGTFDGDVGDTYGFRFYFLKM
jgi:hypothetical protein